MQAFPLTFSKLWYILMFVCGQHTDAHGFSVEFTALRRKSGTIILTKIKEWRVLNIMAENKTLLDKWRSVAYDEKADKGNLRKLWDDYFQKEKEVYRQLLANPDEVVTGTVKELAEKYDLDIMTMTGFLDGINDSLKTPNPIEEMDEDTQVNLGFEKEHLYKNMVAAEADWLYGLPEWKEIFDEARLKELYKEQKSSTTIVKEARIYPNDPCPCGSGKKYKKCCGKNKEE